MKCPFNVNKKTVIQTTSQNSENEAIQVMKQTETFTLTECYESECMAYKNGECMLGVWGQQGE